MTDWDDLKRKYGEKVPASAKSAASHPDMRRLAAAVITIAIVGVLYFFLYGLAPSDRASIEAVTGSSDESSASSLMAGGSGAAPDTAPVGSGSDIAAGEGGTSGTQANATGNVTSNSSSPNSTVQAPAYVSPCGSSIRINEVAGDRVVISSSGPDQVTGVNVRDFVGNAIGSVGVLSGQSVTLQWARGSAAGVVASGTCNGIAVSSVCQPPDSCWNSTAVQQQCSPHCLSGWNYNQAGNSCSENSCVDSCVGFDNVTTFEAYSACSALIQPENVAECSNLLDLPSVTIDTVSIVNSGSLDATNVTVRDDSQNAFGSPFTVSAGSNQSAGWVRGSSAAAYVFWSCGGGQYGVFCPQGEACWQ
ncbi:MAG: hypothetical protein HY833_00590 [Candidatus Aenigmarchaeota archaeon]|nr:hypothetical protein [Candidatus Aenigmarchaeota archaeon]